MKVIKKLLVIAGLSIMFYGCGSVSGFQPTTDMADNTTVNLNQYQQVLVEDIRVTTKNSAVNNLGTEFSDLIASHIQLSNKFKHIYRHRDKLDNTINTLVISGDITRAEDGNATLRLLVGFGAGGAYFDSTIFVKDQSDDRILGKIVIDKNSWALGGGIASSQNIDYFMNESAKKIASELSKLKDQAQLALKH